jgi:hypothetical protein
MEKIANFNTWRILENLGNGEETFTETLSYSGSASNLDLWTPLGWGEMESATGKLTYTARLDVDRSGIAGVSFTIDRIELAMEFRTYQGKDDDEGTVEEKEIVFDKENIGSDPKVEINSFPLYLHTLEIDFRQSEDIDGEVDLKKVKFEMTIGHIE